MGNRKGKNKTKKKRQEGNLSKQDVNNKNDLIKKNQGGKEQKFTKFSCL